MNIFFFKGGRFINEISMFILEIGKHEMNTITVKMIYLQLMKMSSYEFGGRKF